MKPLRNAGIAAMTEAELIQTAEQHEDDIVANEAMRLLREKYDSTHFWCDDCDFLVVKQSECCLNRINNNQ